MFASGSGVTVCLVVSLQCLTQGTHARSPYSYRNVNLCIWYHSLNSGVFHFVVRLVSFLTHPTVMMNWPSFCSDDELRQHVGSIFESLDAEIRVLVNVRHETVVIMSKPRKEAHLLCPNWRMMYRPVSLKEKENKTSFGYWGLQCRVYHWSRESQLSLLIWNA